LALLTGIDTCDNVSFCLFKFKRSPLPWTVQLNLQNEDITSVNGPVAQQHSLCLCAISSEGRANVMSEFDLDYRSLNIDEPIVHARRRPGATVIDSPTECCRSRRLGCWAYSAVTSHHAMHLNTST